MQGLYDNDFKMLVSITNKCCNMLPGRAQNYHHVTLANGEIIEKIYQPQIFHTGHETEFCIIVLKKKKLSLRQLHFFLHISEKCWNVWKESVWNAPSQKHQYKSWFCSSICICVAQKNKLKKSTRRHMELWGKNTNRYSRYTVHGEFAINKS